MKAATTNTESSASKTDFGASLVTMDVGVVCRPIWKGDGSLNSFEGNHKTSLCGSSKLDLRKRIREICMFQNSSAMSMVVVFVLLSLLQSVQLAHSFRWMLSLAKQSPRKLDQPPLPTAALGRQPCRTKTATQSFFGFALQAQMFDSQESLIDYQSDDMYGRGEMHLSAAVNEGDTVVYRTGSWYVNGVLVGDEDAIPAYELCRIETIQIVWTHNCEHGYLRGLAVDLSEGHPNNDGEDQHLSLRTPLDDVEFGPEQIIARIGNVVWEPNHQDESGEGEIGTCSLRLDSSMWKEHDANASNENEDE